VGEATVVPLGTDVCNQRAVCQSKARRACLLMVQRGSGGRGGIAHRVQASAGPSCPSPAQEWMQWGWVGGPQTPRLFEGSGRWTESPAFHSSPLITQPPAPSPASAPRQPGRSTRSGLDPARAAARGLAQDQGDGKQQGSARQQKRDSGERHAGKAAPNLL
jgi:hypothetical protein